MCYSMSSLRQKVHGIRMRDITITNSIPNQPRSSLAIRSASHSHEVFGFFALCAAGSAPVCSCVSVLHNLDSCLVGSILMLPFSLAVTLAHCPVANLSIGSLNSKLNLVNTLIWARSSDLS